MDDASEDYFDDPAADVVGTVLCEARQELNNIASLPDTQMVKESTLPFSREGLWAVARAMARARALYVRFLYLISELAILEGFETAQYADVLGTAGLREAMVNVIMRQLRPEFFFF